MSCDPDLDTVALAREAVSAGLISKDVLDHLTSLHHQVPNSMKYRYLLMQLYNTINNDEQLFIRMVRSFVKFPTSSTSSTKDDCKLGTEHIPDLAELLVPYAYQWRSIGTGMRFKPQDLNNIQAKNQSKWDLLKQCLLSLLEDWVQKRHDHTLEPTVKALENVLSSNLVGLGALACELKAHLASKRGIPTVNQGLNSYFIVSVGITESGVNTTYSKSMHRIEAEEKTSVLLETQVVSEEALALTYQWHMNGTPIRETAVHTGTTTPILCMSADIDMDRSKYSCKVTNNEKVVFATEDITLRVTCPLGEYTVSLVSMYSAQPEVPKDTWPPVSSSKHINLALIKQEGVNYGEECAHLTIRGDMDDILQDKKRVKYDEVLEGLKSKQVLFIEGRPGCGKTTFVHKITRDWANTPNGALRLVLLVSLRVLNQLNKPTLDLSDILDLFKDLKVSKKLLEERNGKGVCFIFDGFDEFSPSDGKNSVVHKIILKEYLHQSTVIVASRPAALAEYRDRADKVIEVLGFPNEQILEYIDNYPFSVSAKSTDLKAYLSGHPNILHMCYLPIHAAMVAFLFKVTGEVPKTETEIYSHFAHFTLKRSLAKHRELYVQSTDVCNLIGEEENLFNQICRLALEKTVLNKQVLHEDEVRFHFQTEKYDISLGLITIDRTAGLYGFKDVYTFLHLTFQEYLAARHISTLSDEEQLKLIEDHGSKNHMLVVWKFYCGLVKFVNKVNFKAILSRTGRARSLFPIQCAYETQQSLPCTLLLKNRKYCFVVSKENLTTPDFTAIGYVMSRSVLPTKLSLINCNMEFNLEALNTLLIQISANLKELDISDNNLGDAGAKFLASGLTSCNKLERINICKNNISFEGIQAIFSGIHQCNLNVNSYEVSCGNNITFKQFVSMLGDCTNLRSLALKLPFYSHEMKHDEIFLRTAVAQCILDNSKVLHTLVLDKFHMDDGAVECLAEALSSCPNLKVLDLSNSWHLYTTGVKAIAASLVNCTDLHELQLNGCEIDSQGATALSLCLKHYQSLRTLQLYSNNIDNLGIKAIADNMQYCKQLQQLDLRRNRFSSDRGREIFAEYHSKCTLEILF